MKMFLSSFWAPSLCFLKQESGPAACTQMVVGHRLWRKYYTVNLCFSEVTISRFHIGTFKWWYFQYTSFISILYLVYAAFLGVPAVVSPIMQSPEISSHVLLQQ